MDGFNISKIILGLQNPELYLRKIKNNQEAGKVNGFAPELNSSLTNSKSQNQIMQNLQNITNMTQVLQMNYLAGIDRSIFIKNFILLELVDTC